MNFLKKTLGKQDFKKDQSKVQHSFTRKHQTVQIWNSNIEDLIQKRNLKKQESSFDRNINKIVEQNIKQPLSLGEEEYKDTIDLFIDAYKKHDKVPKNGTGTIKWQICKDLVKKLKKKANDSKLAKFIHELEIELTLNEKDEKRKKLQEFDTMISFKNYNHKVEEKPQKQQKTSKLFKKQKQEKKNSILNKSQSRSKKSMKSDKNLSSNSIKKITSLSRKKSQGDIQLSKLQNLLKDVSTKVVKGNVQYDYSSILQGSKSNIHCRKNKNMTQKQQPKAIDKKVKKNQAFVFYRPARGI